ncbi:helix-turn-helix domain-containing protein [Janthinobacterium sp. PLB04]|uniref:Helix-turn-helix domain-containing protein n=1 Tax=Janthinobacterium lividum TaxID=29581 RepID=A0AAJ4MNJ8_9BURK|nr:MULTISPECIES: helix-turn-helix transcriptional regulator [Janthinobacterium]KAB0325106.1 helix-turn-helix domain-containing protein [Janthinobacterium lividum]QSX94195.1 helix-turn-helix domain-containing protein [Janthinobacterium lividum]UGQ33963.1 helix-turn-helix domain-containing protein [Janthinobacterium sp. PLB04]
MGLLERFGAGLQKARKSRGLTQEDFSIVSSRTYLSSLERGLKAPTISKIDEISSVMEVHPLSLLALAYLPETDEQRKELWERVHAEIQSFDRIFPDKRGVDET